jgi:NitT/TauT family transport system substrate-binding protein
MSHCNTTWHLYHIVSAQLAVWIACAVFPKGVLSPVAAPRNGETLHEGGIEMRLRALSGWQQHHTSTRKRCRSALLSALWAGLLGVMLLAPIPPAEALRDLKFSHGSGLCNMTLFYAGEKQLFHKYGLNGIVVLTPMAGDSAIQLATGQVEMGVIPYTNAIAAYTRTPAFSVVAGSGIQGLIIVAKPEIKTFEDLKGKKIGTFQADTLDIIVYDYLKAKGLTYADVQMQYLGDSVELTNAFIAGHLDAISSIEPYATKARQATNGNVLGDGTDIYGKGYPDCVLVARRELMTKEPDVVKNVIRTFMEAEHAIESDFEAAAKLTIGKYYKTDMASILAAAKAQPPGVDIRNQRDFMYSRAQSMKELNYISKDPDDKFVDFTLLEQVIKESPELWEPLKVKSAAP